MNRVVLHLLGSVVLAIALLGVAEIAGRSEAHAGSPTPTLGQVASAAASDAIPEVVHADWVERCWKMAGLQKLVLDPKPIGENRQIVIKGQPLGWSFLPPHFLAG